MNPLWCVAIGLLGSPCGAEPVTIISPYCAPAPVPAQLCINGHPAPRRRNVTYGCLPVSLKGDTAHPWCTSTGCERDHIIPLGLGGLDVLDNLQYQPWPPAHIKDAREKKAEEDYCAGKITLDDARSQFHREWPN